MSNYHGRHSWQFYALMTIGILVLLGLMFGGH